MAKNIKPLFLNKYLKPKLLIRVGLTASVSLLATVGLLLTATPAVNAAACVPPATTYGTDTMTVSAPTATTYNVWVRMQTPSTTVNSIMLQVDGSTCYNVGGSSSITPNTWTWVDYQNGSSAQLMQIPLTAASHSLELIGTQPGVEVDNILLLANAGCTPTGTGTNCTTNQPAPGTPTLSATAASATSVKLNWTQSTDSSGLSVAGYYVFRGSTKIATITSPTTLTYTDTVTAGSTNIYTVEAYDNSSPVVTSPASNAVSITPGLTAPTKVTATAASTTQVNLTWAASTDNGGTLAGYNVLRNGALIASVSGTTTSYSDKSVAAGTTYSYVIQAVDSSSPTDTASSTAVTVTTPAPTPAPGAPTNVTATANAYNSVALSWTASTDTGGTVAGYYIIRNGVTITQVAGGSTTKYTDNSVLASTTYSYTIEAFDSNTPPNVSSPSTAASVTTPAPPDTTPPSQPTGLSATAVSSSQINLAWTASTDNTGVAGYTIYRNGTQLTTVTTNSYGDTGLTASTSYSYYVVAYDTGGNKSLASSTVSATTQAVAAATITVEGTVTSSTTNNPLAGVYVYTGVDGTANGAATSYTNSAGQYVLSNISTDFAHSYSYVDNGYTSVTFSKSFPAGVNVVNEALVPTASNPTLLLGNATVQATPDNDNSGQAEAFKAKASSSGSTNQISVYVDSGSAATKLIAGIYSSSRRGHPSSLLGQGSLSSPVSGAWNTVQLSTAVKLTSGTTYWIAILGTGGQLNFRDSNAGSSQTSSSKSLTGLPSSWSGGSTYNSGPVSAYASD